MNILVTGGAGFIGSVMTQQLVNAGHTIVVIDNLESGHEKSVDSRATFQKVDLQDRKHIESLFNNQPFDAVMHFAGVISMAESMHDPGKYFMVNTMYALQMLEIMRKHKVRYFIFSSSAGVYGNPTEVPIPENHPKNPTNPYGESKLMVEGILRWYDKIYSLKSVSLRYFNAAGASLDGVLGEMHKNESHIIPLAIKALMEHRSFTLYGDDYDTPDGTCVRDYIHIEDLCRAHLLALEHLQKTNKSTIYNVGTGKGYSNRKVVAMVEQVSGRKLNVVIAPRRPGDASTLVADSSKLRKELAWEPKHSDLKTIVETAWKFHTTHENRH